MSDDKTTRSMQAGQAFMDAVNADPQAKQSLADAQRRLREFGLSVKLMGVSSREINCTMQQVLAEMGKIMGHVGDVRQELIQEGLAKLRAEQEQLFTELKREAEASIHSRDQELAKYGFEPPGSDLDSWAELARITENDPGPMTMNEIYLWAIAWAKRELLRRKMDRSLVQISAGHDDKQPPSERSAEDTSIFRDEHDRRIAWCVGKRIYLGNDTQVSRLFWLLASPVGRARTLGEVQRAVDGMETSRQMDESGDEYKKASQRLRQAVSKLRAVFCEAEIDNHLLIVRGGTQKHPEYTMVLRFGDKT